jgi:hypothetical protein
MENVQGQITPDTLRGKAIKSTIQQNDCNKIVEIGTWKGMGTTLCILQSMKDGCDFTTLESDITMYDIANNNLKEHKDKLKMIYGSISEISEINEFVSDIYLDDQQKGWLDYDIESIKNCPNVLNLLPESIDFLLLDGGEFSTYSEWMKLKSRSEIVALDDINCLKTRRIFKELVNDSNYVLLHLINEVNGFAIFQKVK